MGQSTRLYGPATAPGAPGAVPLNTSGAIAGVLPATQTIATTTETVLPNPSVPSAPLLTSVPSGSVLEQEVFEIVASGIINTGASSTVTIKLYSGTSFTVGSDTQLATSGAITAFTGKANWSLKCTDCVYDSVSGKLTGKFEFIVNGNVVGPTVFSNTITGINNNQATGVAVLNLLLSITFGTGNAANSWTVKDFGINH